MAELKPLKISHTEHGELLCGVSHRICRKPSDDEIYPCFECLIARKYFNDQKPDDDFGTEVTHENFISTRYK